MDKDQTYIVFEYEDIPGDPVNSNVNVHVCNSREVFSWIQAAFEMVVLNMETTIAIHELGPCVFESKRRISWDTTETSER